MRGNTVAVRGNFHNGVPDARKALPMLGTKCAGPGLLMSGSGLRKRGSGLPERGSGPVLHVSGPVTPEHVLGCQQDVTPTICNKNPAVKHWQICSALLPLCLVDCLAVTIITDSQAYGILLVI